MSTTLEWLRAAMVRALKTAAQAMIATLGTGAIGIMSVDWQNVLSIAAMAMVLSLLTSIAGLPEVDDGKSLSQINAPAPAKHAAADDADESTGSNA